MTSRYAIDLNAPDKITLRRRDAVVEALCALDIHDIVLRGIAVVVEGEPVLDLHVDFETEKFFFWITISQRFDEIVVHRDRKGDKYERRKFRLTNMTGAYGPIYSWIRDIVSDV